MLFALILGVLLLEIASADLIAPGFKVIPTTNKITNINSFPNHVFIFTAKLGENVCALELIETDGILPSNTYKFCNPSVYAIERSNFNEEEFNKFQENLVGYGERDDRYAFSQVEEFLAASNAKQVITNIKVYSQVPVSSAQESITYLYEIDLSQTFVKPTDSQSERNYLIYVYTIIPIIAVIIILLIIFLRKKK